MNREQLKQTYIKYNLSKDDIFMLKFGKVKKPIIRREGIEKIQNKLGIQIKYDVQKISDDHKHVVILGTGIVFDTQTVVNGQSPKPKFLVSSFGECSPLNNNSNYPIAIAEKRAKARIVLQISGLYQFGVYSEDEAESFKKPL
jgi:hypothetical protein